MTRTKTVILQSGDGLRGVCQVPIYVDHYETRIYVRPNFIVAPAEGKPPLPDIRRRIYRYDGHWDEALGLQIWEEMP